MELIEIKIKNEESIVIQYDVLMCGQLIYKEEGNNIVRYYAKFRRGLSPIINLYDVLKDVEPQDIEYIITDVYREGTDPRYDKFNVTLTDIKNIYSNVYVENDFITHEIVLEVG